MQFVLATGEWNNLRNHSANDGLSTMQLSGINRQDPLINSYSPNIQHTDTCKRTHTLSQTLLWCQLCTQAPFRDEGRTRPDQTVLFYWNTTMDLHTQYLSTDHPLSHTSLSYCSCTRQAFHSSTAHTVYSDNSGRIATQNSQQFFKQWALEFTQKHEDSRLLISCWPSCILLAEMTVARRFTSCT